MHQMRFSKELYSKVALLKAAYSFTDRAFLHIDVDESHYIVTVSQKDGLSVTGDEFMNEMLCQSLRHEVYEQTKTLRELLVARSIASTVVEQKDTACYTDNASSFSEEEIVSDWFDTNHEA